MATEPPDHRRLPALTLEGLDCPNPGAVRVQQGPENPIAGHRRLKYVQYRSHAGREAGYCSYDGLGGFILTFNKLSGLLCSMRAT